MPYVMQIAEHVFACVGLIAILIIGFSALREILGRT